jgi:hypothetical protein
LTGVPAPAPRGCGCGKTEELDKGEGGLGQA